MAKRKKAAHKQAASEKTQYIAWLKDISIKDIPLVGGKNASLGEMYSHLSKKGVQIPNGFALTAHAYNKVIEENNLLKPMKVALANLDITDIAALRKAGKEVRELLLGATLPKEVEDAAIKAYEALAKKAKKKTISVAVRSSATAEDLPEASFAGQQETYLNVRGKRALLDAIKKCMASLFTDRAISYREKRGYDHLNIALSVTVQEMVHAHDGTSGVIFTLDTESGFQGVTLVTASYGLGEYVVKGRVIPDQFYIFKEGLRKGKKAIISRRLGTKQVKLVYGKKKDTMQQKVEKKDQRKFCISDDDVLTLAKWAEQIESYYGSPQDIEWAKDGKTGKLYILQSRPETVKTQTDHAVIKKYKLKKEGTQVLSGIAIGQKIGVGKVRVIEKPSDMKYFKQGEVLVTRITDPDWEPIMRLAAAIVTEQGGKTSHAAIVSRELGVPCIVGASQARKKLKTGRQVTVSCAKGDEGIIYKGILPFEVQTTQIEHIPKTNTKIMMNVGDPDHAFALSFLPNDGVGLARQEFIFSNFIRIHPLALLNYSKLKDKQAKKKIQEMTHGYKKKSDYCVDRLAEGMSRIAAAVYPKPVTLRLSDFKTNEYATLIGGKEFEPEEQNPMLGWRGASRYYSNEYKKAFELECKAIKKAREEYGLDNIIVMVPFCRTPEEGEEVLKTMKKFGLEQGKHGLQVYVMCEIPSNVILAEEFVKLFDGVSIGSNDLTQLTLGIDRDSPLVSHIYNENNPAVKKLIKEIIRVCHKHKKPVSICGQAPSDSPEFAEFLVQAGIDSMSLNPDSMLETYKRVAYVEKTVGKTGSRTNKRMLSMIGALAVMAAGFIGMGAGCGMPQATLDPVQDISPAMIREKAVEKALEQKLEEDKYKMVPLIENNFAQFSLEYPLGWSVQYWKGGLTLWSPDKSEHVSIYKQLIAPPIKPEFKQSITINTAAGTRFDGVLPHNGVSSTIIEIPRAEETTIAIEANTPRLDDILSTLTFTHDQTIITDRPLNHWDVREGRTCIQVITYAREEEESQCEAFGTPCEVPEGWEVCDEDNL